MKFLIDNALSPHIATGLLEAGYDAVHVREYHMEMAEDSEISDRAALEERIVISVDHDFGALLAAQKTSKPSFILFHRSVSHLPVEQLKLLLANIPAVQTDLESGCVAVIEAHRLRIRRLPIGG